MNRLFILVCIFILLPDFAFSASYLAKMSKSEDKDSLQLFMSFDQVPRHDSSVNGKRLNIVLRGTAVDEKTKFFKENDKIIKILTKAHKNDTIISLFFRYTPQKVSIVPSKNNTLVADILLGNRFSKTYQDFSSQLQGVTLLNRQTKDFANPLVASPYAYDWNSFFAHYESPVSITTSVKITIPSFPVIQYLPPGKGENINSIPDEGLAFAKEGSWSKVSSIVQQEIKAVTNIEIQKLLALTYGEALLHAGNFEGSYKQLYLLKDKYPKEQIGLFASYLLGILMAVHGDPYGADFELKTLKDNIRHNNPLVPYLQLSIIETSLATNQLDQMKMALARDDLGYPKDIEYKRELRQADYFFATDQSVKAYVSYQLVSENNTIEDQPFSLNGYCTTLYNQHSFQESAKCYEKLAPLVEKRSELGKTYFRAAMSKLKYTNDIAELTNEFSRIEDAFPGTEAGFRAALKKTDIQYLTRSEWADTATKYYHALATKSDYRPVSEEAYFKEALLYHLSGDNEKSINLIMTLLRNFRSGAFRPNAEALLIQLLPGELKRLIDEKDYIAALTLAKQNRQFFENNWIDIKLLSDLAFSYRQLGIFNDALQLYHYLVQIAGIEEKEHYFLPLAEIAFEKGDYDLVEDYTTQYIYYYPEGNFIHEVNYLRIKSYFASDRIVEAIQLLPDPLPDSSKFKYLAADLHFSINDYETVSTLLYPLQKVEKSFPDYQTFILAESLFHLNNIDQAEPLFEKCRKKEIYADQSIYRLAQISRMKGNETKALELFSEISNQKEDSLWKKYAQKELRLNDLSKSL